MSESKLFGVANDRATLCKAVEPWAFQAQIPPALLESKPLYLKWRGDPATEHQLYMGVEGVNPDMRPNSKTNEPRRLHALVVDFDGEVNTAMEENVLASAPSDLRPAWVSETFSGGRRLVYFLERPVPFDKVIAKAFLTIAARELKLQKLLPGFDEKAFLNLFQIYDTFDGAKWKRLSEQVIPSAVVNLWMVQAAKSVNWSKVGDVTLPLEVAREAIESKYPGGWTGEWTVGARGCCFWAGGKNPTSSILTENGFISWSDQVAKLFTPWSELIDASVIRKHQADRIGSAAAEIHWDGRTYYRKHGNGRWWGNAKEDLVIHLKVKHGMDSGKNKHDSASEVEKMLHFIHEHRRIAGVIPKVFDPNDIVYMNGLPYLNCATIRPMPPADVAQVWGENFPWIAGFLDKRWEPMEQADFFFAWWRRAYCSALQGDLQKGQSLFIAGKPGLGKTLLTLRLIGASMGGCADASDFVNSSTSFNKALLETAIWTIDDNASAADAAAHRRFSEMVKKLAANPLWNYHAKFKDAASTEWNGRLCVSLNDDASSVSVIPDLAASMEDKILLLRFSDDPVHFPPKSELESAIQSELPYFLRWLVDFTPPEHVVGTNRFGVKSYIHEGLKAKALHAGGVSDLLELIGEYKKRSAASEKSDHWVGSASGWISLLSADDTLKMLVSKYTVQSLGRKFREAARLAGSGVEVVSADEKRGNTYRVSLKSEDEPRGVVRFTPAVAEASAR